MALSDDIKKILRNALLTTISKDASDKEDYIIAMNSLLQNDSQAIELIEFIDNNNGINSDDVCMKALEISGELENMLDKSAD